MKKYILIIVLLFVSSVTFSQQIKLDKNSLVINEMDSVIISNIGNNTLKISLIAPTNSVIGYSVEIIKIDTSYGFFLHRDVYELGDFYLSPSDSAKFIFYEPDLCIVCKKTSATEYFEDTVIIISNSLVNDTTNLFVSGEGHPSSIEQINTGSLPKNISLEQNYPNPFNPSTIIEYSLSESGYVKLELYNSVGERAATLFRGYQNSGVYKYTFNAEDISSGVYYYILIAKGYREAKKMIYLK